MISRLIVVHRRCAQACVGTLNGKQSWSISMSNDTSNLALDFLLGGLNWISIVSILGDAHIAYSTSTHKHKDSRTTANARPYIDLCLKRMGLSCYVVCLCAMFSVFRQVQHQGQQPHILHREVIQGCLLYTSPSPRDS